MDLTGLEGFDYPLRLELSGGFFFFAANLLLVRLDSLDEVEARLSFFLEGRRQLPNAVVVGENGRAELLDLGGEKDGLQIGGVDCVPSDGRSVARKTKTKAVP